MFVSHEVQKVRVVWQLLQFASHVPHIGKAAARYLNWKGSEQGTQLFEDSCRWLPAGQVRQFVAVCEQVAQLELQVPQNELL